MFYAGYRMLGAGALGWPREMVWEGRWEEGSGLGIQVHPWRIHVDVWQNQYCILKLKKKKNFEGFLSLKLSSIWRLHLFTLEI